MEKFCILAGSQKGKTCAALVQQVLNHKSLFTFGELLEVPSIQQLNNTEGCSSAYLTLQMFAYGVYREYLSDRSNYLELTPTQMHKLRQLTLVTLCEQNNSVSYATLQHELDITDTRQLEELLIETTYLGLIQGKIDQRGSLFLVTARVSGRDVRPEDIDEMIQKLTVWREKCRSVCGTVRASNTILRGHKEAETVEAAQLQAQVDRVKEGVKVAAISSDGAAGGRCEPQAGTKAKRTRAALGNPGYF